MRLYYVLSVLLACSVLSFEGCMTFTERDYELQEQSYQKERSIKEQQQQDTWSYKW